MLDHLPIFGVCGFSGSGKTTLLEAVVPRLIGQGLRVAVVKHDVHGIDRDPTGKDSDRLFHAGADVVLYGPNATLEHRAAEADGMPLAQVADLAMRYDLVLVEGFKTAPWRKCWLARRGEDAAPATVENVLAVLPWDSGRADTLVGLVNEVVQRALVESPLYGCVLIGGNSSRMGAPKHLLRSTHGPHQTWLHRTVALVGEVTSQVVISGRGDVPQDLTHLPRLPDPPGIEGPMAGLLAALRWAPRVSWLLVACDLPCLTDAALRWLLARRRPGLWAVLPQQPDASALEPLLAWYDCRCRDAVEAAAAGERTSLSRLGHHPKAAVVTIPPALRDAWSDADTPSAAAAAGRPV